MPTPLLEEKGNVSAKTTITQFKKPTLLDGTMVWTRFASCYQPIDALKSEAVERAKKWFSGDEPNCSRYFS